MFSDGQRLFPRSAPPLLSRQTGERKAPWHYRLDLIVRLIGLVFGPVFVLSVAQKQVDSVLISYNSPGVGEGSLTALTIAVITVNLCWIALAILLLYQMLKHFLVRFPATLTQQFWHSAQIHGTSDMRQTRTKLLTSDNERDRFLGTWRRSMLSSFSFEINSTVLILCSSS